jgi:hypothetical protein
MTLQTTTLEAAPVQLVPEGLIDEGLVTRAMAIKELGLACDADWQECHLVISALKDELKKTEAKRKEKARPFNEVVDSITSWYRPFIQKLKALEFDLSRLYSEYYRKQEAERARQRAEQVARELAEQKRAEREAEKAKASALFDDEAPKPAQAYTPPPPPKPKPAPAPPSNIRRNWKARVVNAAKVPREYLVPSNDLIMKAFRGGIREIPGVEFYAEDTVIKA